MVLCDTYGTGQRGHTWHLEHARCSLPGRGKLSTSPWWICLQWQAGGQACLGPLFLIPEESSHHHMPTRVSVCGGCASLIESPTIPSSVPRGPQAEEGQRGLSATGFGNTQVLGIPFALLLHLLRPSGTGHLSPGLHSLTWAALPSPRAGTGTAPGAGGSSSPPAPPGAAALGRAPRAQPASRRACGQTDRVGVTNV